MGGFVYVFLGTTPQLCIGPTALVSLLTLTYTQNTDVDMVILLTFLCGCITFLLGVLQLGTNRTAFQLNLVCYSLIFLSCLLFCIFNTSSFRAWLSSLELQLQSCKYKNKKPLYPHPKAVRSYFYVMNKLTPSLSQVTRIVKPSMFFS